MKFERRKTVFTYEIVTMPAYRAVGLKWNGPYSEVSSLKQVIYSMSNRVEELEYVLNPDLQLGLSYHLRPDGFVHYSVYEVTEEQQVPEGMIEIYVPEMTYLVTSHPKGENIGETYSKISSWMQDGEYEPFVETDITYYDSLPIKHERYPANRDLEDPHFDILIPITKIPQIGEKEALVAVKQYREILNSGDVLKVNKWISDDFIGYFGYYNDRDYEVYDAETYKKGNVGTLKSFQGKNPIWDYEDVTFNLRAENEIILSSIVTFYLSGKKAATALAMEIFKKEENGWKLYRQHMERYAK